MNKYQKCIDYLKWLRNEGLDVVNWHLNGEKEPLANFLSNVDIESLQELVDKETPKKVKVECDYELYDVKEFFTCPVCNETSPLLYDTNYCCVCGHKIKREVKK